MARGVGRAEERLRILPAAGQAGAGPQAAAHLGHDVSLTFLEDSSSLQDYQAGVAGCPRQAAGEVGAEEAPERRGHWGTSCGDRLKWSNWKK